MSVKSAVSTFRKIWAKGCPIWKRVASKWEIQREVTPSQCPSCYPYLVHGHCGNTAIVRHLEQKALTVVRLRLARAPTFHQSGDPFNVLFAGEDRYHLDSCPFHGFLWHLKCEETSVVFLKIRVSGKGRVEDDPHYFFHFLVDHKVQPKVVILVGDQMFSTSAKAVVELGTYVASSVIASPENAKNPVCGLSTLKAVPVSLINRRGPVCLKLFLTNAHYHAPAVAVAVNSRQGLLAAHCDAFNHPAPADCVEGVGRNVHLEPNDVAQD